MNKIIVLFIIFLIFTPIEIYAQSNYLLTEQTAPVILEAIELPVQDADGIALGDLTGNGRVDILTSEGKHGTTIWFEQGQSWRDWTKHHIYTIDKRPSEIEGNALGDFDGDGRFEALSLDQPNGDIYLHKFKKNPRGEWDTSLIKSNRPYVQDALIVDIDDDGQIEIVYTWQGEREGEGGVHWLKLTGQDPLNPEHWQDYVMVVHESAWWLAPRLADLSNKGKKTDIIYTAKNSVKRNEASKPGLFWLEPSSDITQPWKMHVIDNSIVRPAHVDMGDLSGEGHGNDIVVSGFDTNVIYWYKFGMNWQRNEIEIPVIQGYRPNYIWNVKTMRLGGQREGILAPVIEQGPNHGALLYYEFIGNQFEPQILQKLDYTHPMDDRILLYDITDDGQSELFIPDSGPNVNKLHIHKLGRDL